MRFIKINTMIKFFHLQPGRPLKPLFLLAITLFLYIISTEKTAAQNQAMQANQEKYHIIDIIISGNKKTKPAVILREMRTQIGDTVSSAELQYDAGRIESLRLFTRVDFSLEERGNGHVLHIVVTEQWYLFPFPIFFFNDRDYKWKKASYGMSLLHTNFRGNAEMLAIAGWLGYNPGVHLTYTIPAINGDRRYFLSAQFFQFRIRSKSLEILNQKSDEKQIGGSLTFGVRPNLINSFQVTLGYSRINYKPPAADFTLNPAGRDHLPRLGFSYVRDTRDLQWYPSQGSLLSLTYQKTGFWNDTYIDFRHLVFDLRHYRSLYKEIILAGRFLSSLSEGALPVYNRAFFGYTTRIRGRYDERYESENLALASVELRFPILPVRYIQIEEAPLGSYGKNLKFGITGSLFIDFGSLWVQRQNIGRYKSGELTLSSGDFGIQSRPKKWLRGFGAGLSFHLPYIQLARLELGLDDDLNHEFIFDAQVSF